MAEMIDVSCRLCGRYVCSAPPGTPLWIYCRQCKIKIELVTKPQEYLSARRR